MSLIFVPADDLSTSAAEASAIVALDLGYVKAGETKSQVIRVANDSSSAVSFELIPESPLTVEPRLFVLPPDSITDTVVLSVSMPLDAVSRTHSATLLASSGETLSVEWETVGANTDRLPQYPPRTGNPTEIASNVIGSLGDTLRLYRFDPVPYDQTTATLAPGRRFKVEKTGKFAGEYETIRANICDLEARLDGSNSTCGYTMTAETIIAQFTSETIEITTTNLTSNNAPLTYSVSATLIVPAEFELLRDWALFMPETETDKAQYKRTVYIVKRQGVLYSVESIRTLEFGESLSHFECDLVAAHSRDMGSPDFFNPWAITYEFESDKPYAVYPLENATIEEYIADASASGELNPSSYEEPEEELIAPLPVSVVIGEVGSIWRAIVTFDSELNAATLDTSNWRIYTGEDRYYPATAIAAGDTVTLETSLASFGIPSTLPPQVAYSAANPDLIGANGATVEAFEILE